MKKIGITSFVAGLLVLLTMALWTGVALLAPAAIIKYCWLYLLA
jgi:hypothetical protein